MVTTGSGSSSSDTKGNDIAAVEGQRTAPAKHCIGKSSKGVSWGFSMDQGRRSTMEDWAVVQPGFMKLCCKDVGGCRAPECENAMDKSLVHYFGIFDGHGGDQVINSSTSTSRLAFQYLFFCLFIKPVVLVFIGCLKLKVPVCYIII